MTHAKGRERRRQAMQRPAPAAPPTARFTEMRAGRALGFPLAFTLLLALFGSSPTAQENPALLWSFLSAAAGLLAWSVALLIAARRAQRVLSLDVVLRKQHYVQACAQLSVFIYWVRLFFVGGPERVHGVLRPAWQELLDSSKAW